MVIRPVKFIFASRKETRPSEAADLHVPRGRAARRRGQLNSRRACPRRPRRSPCPPAPDAPWAWCPGGRVIENLSSSIECGAAPTSRAAWSFSPVAKSFVSCLCIARKVFELALLRLEQRPRGDGRPTPPARASEGVAYDHWSVARDSASAASPSSRKPNHVPLWYALAQRSGPIAARISAFMLSTSARSGAIARAPMRWCEKRSL